MSFLYGGGILSEATRCIAFFLLLREVSMWKRTGVAFDVKSAKGQTFRVIEEVEIIDAKSFDDPKATIEGLKRLATTTGLHVNSIGGSEFEILGVGPLLEEVRVKRI